MSLTIGVDIGGTKIAGGVVDPEGTVLDTHRVPTPTDSARSVENAIVEVVSELRRRHPVAAVGVGAAGYIDAQRATVLFSPNLPWVDEPLQAVLQDALGLPVFVENDANAAAWAEFRFGAGRDVDDLLMVAIGTGIGGGIVLDGRLFRGTFGIAAEFGHITLVPGGRLCGCGELGCWEQYASGRALVAEVRAVAQTGAPAARTVLAAAGDDPAAITGPLVTQAAQHGDPLCIQAFRAIAGWLGQGLSDLASIFDPGVVVIGGGVSEAGDLLLHPTRQAFLEHLSGRGHRPEMQIRPAALGNAAGMIGASDLARQP